MFAGAKVFEDILKQGNLFALEQREQVLRAEAEGKKNEIAAFAGGKLAAGSVADDQDVARCQQLRVGAIDQAALATFGEHEAKPLKTMGKLFIATQAMKTQMQIVSVKHCMLSKLGKPTRDSRKFPAPAIFHHVKPPPRSGIEATLLQLETGIIERKTRERIETYLFRNSTLLGHFKARNCTEVLFPTRKREVTS
jgi:hypothetical protein